MRKFPCWKIAVILQSKFPLIQNVNKADRLLSQKCCKHMLLFLDSLLLMVKTVSRKEFPMALLLSEPAAADRDASLGVEVSGTVNCACPTWTMLFGVLAPELLGLPSSQRAS